MFKSSNRFTISNFLCSNCQGDDYYEDAAGAIICNYCGIQSQDYIAESNEAGEDDPIFTQPLGTHSIRRRSHILGSQMKLLKTAQYTPELLDYLAVYQYQLQMIGNMACQLIFQRNQRSTLTSEVSADLHQTLLKTLKSLWIKYLQGWQSANTTCQLSYVFSHNSINCHCMGKDNATTNSRDDDEMEGDAAEPQIKNRTKANTHKFHLSHPLYPTKPLLLGFLYLLIRIHRLDIIIADLIRWIERGLLPYYNLWDCLPEQLKLNIPSNFRKPFNQQYNIPYGVVTPMNVWFHCCHLAESVGLGTGSADPLPPLNGPLIGFSIIKSLGLPEKMVSMNFAKLIQLFTTAAPIQDITADEHYVEYIMAVIVLACVMTNDWMQWEFLTINDDDLLLATDKPTPRPDERNDDYDEQPSRLEHEILPHQDDEASRQKNCSLPMITHQHQMNLLLKRKHLSTLLTQFHRTIPREMKNTLHLKEYLNESFSSFTLEEKESIQYLISSRSNECRMPDLYLAQRYQKLEDNSLNEEPLSPLSPTGTKKKTGKRRNGNSNPVLTPKSQQNIYLSCIRHKINGLDTTGYHFLQYTLLVERCAKYLYISPLLLHVIIESLDIQIMELALYGKISSSTDNISKKKKQTTPVVGTLRQKINNDRVLERNDLMKEYEKYLGEEDLKRAELSLKSYPKHKRKEIERYQKYRESSDFNFPVINRLIQLQPNQSKPLVHSYDLNDVWWDQPPHASGILKYADEVEGEEDEEDKQEDEEEGSAGSEEVSSSETSVSEDGIESLLGKDYDEIQVNRAPAVSLPKDEANKMVMNSDSDSDFFDS